MAFTSSLGTASSYLGNVELGTGAVPSGNYNENVSVSGFSAVRLNQTHFLIVSVDGLGGAAPFAGSPKSNTLTVDGLSAVTPTPGSGYFRTLSVDGLGSVVTASNYGVGAALSVNALASVAAAGALGLVLTVAGFSAHSEVGQIIARPTVVVGAFAAFDSPGGVVYLLQQAIQGLAAATPTPGIGYFTTLSVDGISDSGTPVQTYFKNLAISVDGIADAGTPVSTYVANSTVLVAGISAATIASSLSSVNFTTVAGQSAVNIENIYDILLDTNVLCTFTVSVSQLKANSEQPTAFGSFSATCGAIFRRTVAQTLVMTQSVVLKQPTGIASHTLVMTQVAFVQTIHPRTVTQTLTMTQAGVAARNGHNTLVMTQSATVVKVRSLTVSQTLVMSQSAARRAVVARTVSQTLTFNVVRQVAAPMIGASGGGNQTQFQFNQPLVSVVLRPTNCLVVLGTPGQTVVLPCPLFGDTQAGTGQMSLKKTMTGDTYTYVKKTTTETLKYSFNLGTYKAIELRSFLLNHSQELITLHNWKGETWYVFITNNPFEFVHAARWQPQGERVDITLEFEGIRR